MLDRVAKAIELAKGNAPYYVLPQFKNKYNLFKICYKKFNFWDFSFIKCK